MHADDRGRTGCHELVSTHNRSRTRRCDMAQGQPPGVWQLPRMVRSSARQDERPTTETRGRQAGWQLGLAHRGSNGNGYAKQLTQWQPQARQQQQEQQQKQQQQGTGAIREGEHKGDKASRLTFAEELRMKCSVGRGCCCV